MALPLLLNSSAHRVTLCDGPQLSILTPGQDDRVHELMVTLRQPAMDGAAIRHSSGQRRREAEQGGAGHERAPVASLEMPETSMVAGQRQRES